jgi:hypothetical protein
MSELQFVLALAAVCTLIGSLAIALYRVRIHHKIIFDDKGELNFVTVQKQKDTAHDFCPVHNQSMEILTKVNLTQANNITRLNGLEETIKEASRSREKVSELLNSLNVNMATLIANMSNMASDIQELKK